MENLFELLRSNPYPGRGIVLGRCAGGTNAIAAYWIMGRSTNSRNRVFEETPDGIRTRAFDESRMEDPSLIIYHPVRQVGNQLVVTNGDQTDTIRDHLECGKTFASALRTREFEPDNPNYTPRISGLLDCRDGSYKLSILKSLNGDPACCQRFFFEYDHPQAGMGHFISTYQGDGNPLPSFAGEPLAVALQGRFDELPERLWDALNPENKVSLFVRYIDLKAGEVRTRIFNKNH
jgi:IMP cyclohydrolase